jgi:Domain of unknown function (DUF222)
MGWQSGQDDGKGETPDPGSGLSGNPAFAESPGREAWSSPDPRLAGFAKGGEWDACPPTAALAATLEAVSGPGWHCPGASRDEMFGLLRQWQALESWAAAGKLGLLRALIRDDAQPLPGGGYHGDLPDGWTTSLTHEVALALSMPTVSADKLMWLAWNLQALLPGIGDLLAGGDLTLAKARAVDQALNLLSEQDAAQAEVMIIPELPGKTYGQVQKLAVQAALTVDPESATRRREDAEQRKSRVEMFREESGAAALSGRDLPTDQTLAAHASVCARAQQYKDSGAFRDDTRMDQYRAAAYLDLLNGITIGVRIASGQLATGGRTAEAAGEPGADDDFPPESDPGDHSTTGRATAARDLRPPDDFGSWTLTLPDGRNLTVRLDQVPTFTCDHRHESHAYQPNDTLRHLVQVRDGDCTFPPCSRPARESDFEHAAPYDKGGRTCACNAGARSRACHQIKQSPGWNVTQPSPGWHQWRTPSGRIYTQGPKHYPA